MKKIRALVVQVVFLLTLALSGAALAAAQESAPSLPNGSTPVTPQAPTGSGGPDGFGYTFLDSKEPDGPIYAWEEISGTGTLVTGWTDIDNGYAGPFPTGFDFFYYGNIYTDFYIGTNGYLSFGQGYGDIPPSYPPPDGSNPNNAIIMFGDNLYLEDYGNETAVYYQTLSNPTRLVIEFANIHYCCSYTTPHTFEVTLYPNGEIQTQYKTLNGTNTSSVGIENVSGSVGLGYGFGLKDSLSVLYSPPNGVLLLPPEQTDYGQVGETVSYTVELQNYTGADDSFDLSLQTIHGWDTSLSITQTGVISNWASLPLTVTVSVPPGAAPGDWDQATLLATSVTSSTVYTDTAALYAGAASDQIAYVTLSGDDRVALVDTVTLIEIDEIDVGAVGCVFPWRATLSPDGNALYVSCYSSGSVAVIDTATSSVVAHITGIPSADDIAFTLDGAYALVGSRWEAQVMVVDTGSQTIVNIISMPGNARSLAAHPYLPIIYATCANGSLQVIDTDTFSISSSVDIGGEPWDVAVSPNGSWIFAGDRQGAGLSVIDANSLTLHTTVGGLGALTGLEVAPDGAQIYALGLSNGVHVIDGASFNLITTINGLGNAWEAGLTCDGGYLLVGNTTNYVPVVDTATYSVTQNIPMSGWGARGIAACPQRKTSEVFLSPSAQSNQGGRGQVVTYQEKLINATGAPDTFDLDLGGNIWDAALSAASIGPLAHGEWATFTVYVTVPLNAEWYSLDSAIVTATSTTSPTLYFASAEFSTQAYAPAEINASPTALSSTQLMNEIVTQTLYISNGEGVTLTFELLEGGPHAQPHILAWTGQTYNPLYTNMLQAIDEHISYALTEYANPYPTPEEMAASLEGQDVLLVPPPTAWYDAMYEIGVALADVLNEFVSGGGAVVTADCYNAASGFLEGSGLMSLDWEGCGGSYPSPLEVTQPDHPYVEGVSATFTGEVATGEFTPNNAVEIVQVQSNGNSVVAARQVGEGQVGMLGFNFYHYNPDMSRLLANAVSQNQMEDVPWLSEEPTVGSLPTSSGLPVEIIFDATGMLPGEYTAWLYVTGKAWNSPVGIPVTMTVQPLAGMGRVSGTVTDAWSGVPLSATVELVGVYPVQANPDYEIWAMSGDYMLRAYASGYYTLTLPVTIPPDGVLLQDVALEPDQPRLGGLPATIQVTTMAGTYVEQSLVLSNTGPALLDFSWYDSVPWLSETPAAGVITGHQVLTTTLGFDASALAPGVYNAVLLLEHNDPAQTSPLFLPVQLNVTAPVYGVSLAPPDQAGEGAPGAVVSYTFAITNQANVSDSFMLQASGVWTTALSAADSGPLAPGERFTVTLDVSIPVDAANGLVDTATLTVTSAADPQVLGIAHAATTARGGQAALSLGPVSQAGQGLRGETLVYTYTLTNLGQTSDNFDLALEAAWSSELSAASSGPLAPGESFEFTLSVTIPAGAPGGSHDTAAVTATSSRDAGQSAVVQATTTAMQAGVGLAAQTQAASGAPGETVVYTFVVQNTGSHADTFALSAAGDWESQLSASTTGLLAPGESFTVTLSVTIPASAADGSMDTAALTAASGLDGSVSGSAQVTTTALIPGWDLYLPVIEK